MSYDYDSIVAGITKRRRQSVSDVVETKRDRLKEVIGLFETLSQHCPMTPLLWIQYSRSIFDFLLLVKAGSEEDAKIMQMQTLELGLLEFPGSTLLHLYYNHLMINSSEPHDKKVEAIKASIEAVGKGSHRNEGTCVAILYRWQVRLCLQSSQLTNAEKLDQIGQIFVNRCRSAMKDANDSLCGEYSDVCQENNFEPDPEVMYMIETGRRVQARLFSRLVSLEDSIDAAMHEEGILFRYVLGPFEQGDFSKEVVEKLEASDDQRYCMGLGGDNTAKAFLAYVREIRKMGPESNSKVADDSDDEQDEALSTTEERIQSTISELALRVYERAVAECPTSEKLWLSYVQYLLHKLEQSEEKPKRSLTLQLQSVVRRGCRNCPYSYLLINRQINVSQRLAFVGLSVFDPEQLLQQVQTALDMKFLAPLPTVSLNLYVACTRAVIHRILHLATRHDAGSDLLYDQPLPLAKKAHSGLVEDEIKDEIADLLDDYSDMLDEVESRLKASFPAWSEGRAILWKQRSISEILLIQPLKLAIAEEKPHAGCKKTNEQTLSYFERACKIHSPTDPDIFLSYIRQFANISMLNSTTVGQVATNLRKVRFLYQKGVQSVGPRRKQDIEYEIGSRPYYSSLSTLCQEWLNFEEMFGSERSLELARSVTSKKLNKASLTNESKHKRDGASRKAQRFANTREENTTAADGAVAKQPTEAAGKYYLGENSNSDDRQVESLVAKETPRQTVEVKRAPEIENKGGLDTHNQGESTEMESSVISQHTTNRVVESSAKRLAEAEVDSERHSAKRHKVEPSVTDNNVANDAQDKEPKKNKKCHPFTVRVSKLDSAVNEIDLVDTFRPLCGPIVHARIVRGKHRVSGDLAESKGWGLIQFEEREAAQKALALNDEIGIKGKLIAVEISHMPAVSVVPPGMHRVNPKGEGKSSKQNQKRKDRRRNVSHGENEVEHKRKPGVVAVQANSQTSANVLAFRPRGVGRAARPKTKLSVKKT